MRELNQKAKATALGKNKKGRATFYINSALWKLSASPLAAWIYPQFPAGDRRMPPRRELHFRRNYGEKSMVSRVTPGGTRTHDRQPLRGARSIQLSYGGLPVYTPKSVNVF